MSAMNFPQPHFQVPANARTRAVGNADFAAAFFSLQSEADDSRHIFDLGTIATIQKWTAVRRGEPFWMLPAVGETAGAVPVETQFLLAQTADENHLIFVPLIDARFRASLQGDSEKDALQLVVESGDAAVVGREFELLFVAVGAEPFALIEYSARVVSEQMGGGRLRVDKADASFSHLFGWCTWDAFYQDVTHDKVRTGLESFARGNVQPRLLILDDGWQSVQEKTGGEKQLTSFAPNEKFGGDLRPTVEMAKDEFGIEKFLVWHAFNGYWGGVDGDSLPGYGARNIERRSSPGILHYNPTIDSWWSKVLGVVDKDHVYRFYHDYHRTLRAQGVDGVKVDVQAAIESVAQGSGGRVAIMRAYREALEGSVGVHFENNLINCMSCSNEMLYLAASSTLTRTSTDFWPNIASSHGLHLWTNAIVSLWFGQFVQPDWDMFQSAHAMGAYHAAARAVAGCPIYVSDKPDTHNFELLKKLILPDGTTLRTQNIGLPTRDCLFADVTRDDALLKIWNANNYGAVIGVFNARYGGEIEIGSASDVIPNESTIVSETQADDNKGFADEIVSDGVAPDENTSSNGRNETHTPSAPVAGHISPRDINDINFHESERFAVWAHHARELRVLDVDQTWNITLPELQAEVFTLAPIENRFAPLGLIEMFNSSAAIEDFMMEENEAIVALVASGKFAAWSERAPQRVTAHAHAHVHAHDGNCNHDVAFSYEASQQLVIVDLPREAGAVQLLIEF